MRQLTDVSPHLKGIEESVTKGDVNEFLEYIYDYCFHHNVGIMPDDFQCRKTPIMKLPVRELNQIYSAKIEC